MNIFLIVSLCLGVMVETHPTTMPVLESLIHGLEPHEMNKEEHGAEYLRGEELIAEMKKVCQEYTDESKVANGTTYLVQLRLPNDETMQVPCSDVENPPKSHSRIFGWVAAAIVTGVLAAMG